MRGINYIRRDQRPWQSELSQPNGHRHPPQSHQDGNDSDIIIIRWQILTQNKQKYCTLIDVMETENNVDPEGLAENILIVNDSAVLNEQFSFATAILF